MSLAAIEERLWLALLLLMPVSSSPLLPFGGGTLARPLAIVPAALLLGLAAWRMIALHQRPRLDPEGFVLLGLFTLYLVVSGLLIVMALPETVFKGQTPLESLLRALLTWAVGVSFYLVARLRIRTRADIDQTLRFLAIGMSASVAFAGLQAVAMYQGGEMLQLVQQVTDLLAVHYDGLVTRAQGMTFEPSWLATQIILLLMPALLAGAMTGQGKAWQLVAGFGVALAGLLFSGSRFGLVGAVGMLLASGLIAALRGRLAAAAIFVGVLATGGAGIAAMSNLGTGAGSTYFTAPLALLSGDADLGAAAGADPTGEVTDALTLAGRAAAGEAAARMWLAYPLFGVSLGNNYRFFGEYAPDWAFTTQLFTHGAKEGVGWLDANSPEKGNAKNMFLRLLSETGLVGFLIAAIFLLRQIFRGRARDEFHLYFRLASAMALGFAFLNQDSFVDPCLWIPLALCFAFNHLE